jgi:hypothetical protein
MVRVGKAARAAQRLNLDVYELPDPHCYTWLRHFMAVRGLTQYEAIELLRRLADRYHCEIRSLTQVRYAQKPYFFGLPRVFLLRLHDGSIVRRKGAGVWIDEIWRSRVDGSRMVRVVFAHSRGKRRYTVELPIDFDVDTINLLPEPPEPVPELPSCHSDVAAELMAACEQVTHERINRFLQRAIFRFLREDPGRFLSNEDQRRVGGARARRYQWVRCHGGWVETPSVGSWLSGLHQEIGAVEVTVERPDGCTRKLICSTHSLMCDDGSEVVALPANVIEPDRSIPGVIRVRDERGAVVKVIVIDEGGLEARWVVGTSVLDALGRAKALRESEAEAA